MARKGYYSRPGGYSASLASFAKKASDITDAVVRGVVLEAGSRIVARSPVGDATLWKNPAPKGYIGGRFKANWQYGNSISGVPQKDLTAIDPSGAVSITRIMTGLPAKSAGLVHTLINNLPYAQRLEDGHSNQAPAGMVMLVQMEFPGIVRDIVAAQSK